MRQGGSLRLIALSIVSLSFLLAFAWLPLVSQPPRALAHAFVIGSDPIDGSTITTPPSIVRIFFNADISPASVAHVYFGPDYQLVDARNSTIASTNPRELDTPLLPTDQLPQGSYTVRWTAIANDDGHATHGVIGFNIGHSSVGLPGEVILGPSTSNILPQLNVQGLLAIAWEWLVMLALTLWVGILVMEGFVLESDLAPLAGARLPLPQIRKQALPLQWLCLAALLVGEIINLVLRSTLFTQASGNNGIDVATTRQLLSETNYGHLWLVRIVLIGIALVFLWLTRRQFSNIGNASKTRRSGRRSRFSQLRRHVAEEQSLTQDNGEQQEHTVGVPLAGTLSGTVGTLSAGQKPQWHTIAWLILAGLILFTFALSGDAVQLAQTHISAVVLTWLNLAAQSIWIGGAAYLGFVLLPLLPVIEPDHHAESLVTLLRLYMPLILVTVGILLVSGLFLGETSISNGQQLITDPYGRALLVRISLIALMLIFTGYALFFLRPKLTRQVVLLPVVNAELPARRTRQTAMELTEQRLKRTMIILCWLGAAVLLCAALMSFFAPPIVFPATNYFASRSSAAAPTSSQNIQTKSAGDLLVTLEVSPARVNDVNTIIIRMKDSSGKYVTDAQVQISINMQLMEEMGTTRATIKGGNATYIVTFDRDTTFSMAGAWNIVVQIQRPHQKQLQLAFQIFLAQ